MLGVKPLEDSTAPAIHTCEQKFLKTPRVSGITYYTTKLLSRILTSLMPSQWNGLSVCLEVLQEEPSRAIQWCVIAMGASFRPSHKICRQTNGVILQKS